jgi:hypothetical protein
MGNLFKAKECCYNCKWLAHSDYRCMKRGYYGGIKPFPFEFACEDYQERHPEEGGTE